MFDVFVGLSLFYKVSIIDRKAYELEGIKCGVGIKMGELIIDERGRVVIPKEIREKLDLKTNQKLIVQAREREIILKPAVNAEQFIHNLKGCVHGSRIKPSELKEIWGIEHAHH